jgi:thaumarchaeosortase
VLFLTIPLHYVLGSSFLGFDQKIIQFGSSFAKGGFLEEHWPLSLEYLVITASFLLAIAIAYGRNGLRSFSTSFSIMGAMGVFYMIDTIFPYSIFAPLQSIALPTASASAVVLRLLGYHVTLNSYWNDPTPLLSVFRVWDRRVNSVAVAWPCAGVHSLFIYVLVMVLYLWNAKFSGLRKVIYFLAGFVGTFAVNVLRIAAYFIVYLEVNPSTAQTVHDVYAELFFLGWMGLFFLSILCIQRFRLVERLREVKNRVFSFAE